MVSNVPTRLAASLLTRISAIFDFDTVAIVQLPPNNAGQWRAASNARYETETLSARPLHQPGWTSCGSLSLREHFKQCVREQSVAGAGQVQAIHRCAGRA